tara:strand:+ start:344 stop:577 length:234 start_codon:yes stop_codon:yes gene_type:complete
MGRHSGCNRGNTKKSSKEEIMAALVEQRKKYKEAFDKVGLHLREVEERKIKLRKKYRDAKKKNKDVTRAKNKNDYYD